MKNVRFLFLICGLTSCSLSQQQTDPVFSNEWEIFSFHKGYVLWKEEFESFDLPYDLELVINGFRAAHRGEQPVISKEEMNCFIRRFREDRLTAQATENLAEAESFFQNLAKDPEMIELIPLQLYYKRIKRGQGRLVTPNDIPLVVYTAKTIHSGIEQEIFSPGDDPIPISFLDTIPGFVQGVVGMMEDEQRTLYIHPDLAYGLYGGGMTPPNKLIIIDVWVAGVAPSHQ